MVMAFDTFNQLSELEIVAVKVHTNHSHGLMLKRLPEGIGFSLQPKSRRIRQAQADFPYLHRVDLI